MTVLMDKCFTKKPKIQEQRLQLGIWIPSLLQDFVWWLVEMSWSWDEVGSLRTRGHFACVVETHPETLTVLQVDTQRSPHF